MKKEDIIKRANSCAERLNSNNLTNNAGIMYELICEVKKLRSILGTNESRHSEDCTIYASIGQPTDGICTCGYGWEMVKRMDCYMYSEERILEIEREKNG